MPLNAGGPGYGSMEGPGLPGSVGAGADAETAPLLIPESDPVPRPEWRPLTKEELEAAADSPGWRRLRWYLVLLFWISWVTILATSIAIIVKSPRPVALPLRWWQKSLFYQLQPQLFMEARTEGAGGINVLCEQLPYLKSLGVGALILEGLFEKKASPLNLTVTGKDSVTIPQIQHLLKQSNKADLKVVLDICDVNLTGPEDEAGNTDEASSAKAQYALRFWLDQGVVGFTICDTDEAYSEKTLLEWRDVFKEFNTEEEERIVLVKQTKDILPPLSNSSQVDVVMKSILPASHHILSAQEVADAIETQLQTVGQDIWTSWTVGGKASQDLQKLLLVLTMTLPGSPAIQDESNIDQTQTALLNLASSHEDKDSEPSESQAEKQHVAAALFNSLSHSRAREEALLYGNFTFLPFNASTNASSNSTLPSPSSPPILAFLRSWGCVHFLVLLNVGSEPQPLDPAWAPSLPEAGVFIASTGMDRVGSTSLYTLELQPQEAIVIKLFEVGSYS